ncbi:NFX1-type zinc finger-containing protein [Colletotrichum sojae]|uniref:NFX1-type zinc finger-containing protein n=1 Tax=Colletotrichum sojae TaxID=2175907 RepID=A0A8H6IRG2_9PEZI|nr:NFX1-type zinc finger-containing protein [Colletotrichum sojae]
MAHSRKRRLTPQELARLCTYANASGRCPYTRVTLVKDNGRFLSPFCRVHCCKKVDNLAACTNLKTNPAGYCGPHLQCTGVIHGQRCDNPVKNYDPKTFKFCSQYHNCLQQGCDSERFHPNGVDMRYCPAHVCIQRDCSSPREPGSENCISHTCAAPACMAACPGAAGDANDASRFCDRHRMCSRTGCRSFAFVRPDGVSMPFCGAHYCRWEGDGGCDAERDPAAEDKTCAGHICVDPGCLRARDHGLEGAQWCKDSHECKFRDCRWRRWLGDWCPEHQCGRPGCDRRGEHNHYCDRHRPCRTPGCDRFRWVDGENIMETCQERECQTPFPSSTLQSSVYRVSQTNLKTTDAIVRCARQGCEGPIVTNTRFCENHLCTLRPCTSERAVTGNGLCTGHKCSVIGCPHRRTRINLAANMIQLIGGEDDMPYLISGYCNGHACRHEQCHGSAQGDTHYCRDHARCRRLECSRVVDLNGVDPTQCAEHNRAGPHGDPDGGQGRRGLLGDPYGYGYAGGGGWPGVGSWRVNAAI